MGLRACSLWKAIVFSQGSKVSASSLREFLPHTALCLPELLARPASNDANCAGHLRGFRLTSLQAAVTTAAGTTAAGTTAAGTTAAASATVAALAGGTPIAAPGATTEQQQRAFPHEDFAYGLQCMLQAPCSGERAAPSASSSKAKASESRRLLRQLAEKLIGRDVQPAGSCDWSKLCN